MQLYFGGVPQGTVYGYEAVSIPSSTHQTLTSATLHADSQAQAKAALVTVETGGNARVRLDGGTPTSSSGHLVSSSDLIGIVGINNLRNFKASWTGSTVSLRVSYLR